MSYPPPSGPPEDNPYAQQPVTPEPQYYQPYGQYAVPGPTGGNNGLAIGGMATGIASIPLACCCWPIAILAGGAAVVLSFIGMNQIKERQQSNRGMAIAGIATGAAGVLLGIVNLIATFAFNWNNFNFSNFN
jgi:hypothetical protein